MKEKIISSFVAFLMLFTFIPAINAYAAQTLTGNKTGTQDGYNYELWKDYGNTSMTLNSGGTFNCQWNNIGNALFRKGKKFDCTKTYNQLGNISVDYACDYNPSGNSYLCVYGWTKSPLIEYYIVDSWGSWRPPGANSKGTITVDGGKYDVYETTRVNQPSIEGNTTFKQYWSVRQSKRTSGTISVSQHFKEWEKKGMKLGKLYETALTVEGYQSSGRANVYKNNIKIGGSSSSSNSGSTGNTGNTGNNNNSGNTGNTGNSGNSNSTSVNTTSKIECENMILGGNYAGKINSPFSGVGLYGNNDSCKITQRFGKGTHDFSLRGCSNNGIMARVDLKIGGEYKGTFYYGGNSPATYTLKNVNHKTGNQEIELVVTGDNGTWDAYVDNLEIK